ncbi:MAG: YceI family protein [Chitinophagales bacterium]|nr:YceI family protein [Chitinophagales bacterium]
MEKFKLFMLTAVIATAIAGCTSSPKGDEAITTDAQEVREGGSDMALKVDPASSTVEWIGTKVTGHHSGTVNIKSGEIMIKEGQINGGSFIMDMPSIVVTSDDPESQAKLGGHLHSADFFEVSKYPEAKLEITQVKPFSGSAPSNDVAGQEAISEYKVTDPNVLISGNLTIKDVTKNVEFPARVTVTGNGATAMAKFMIDRKLWNINYAGAPDNLVRDDVWFGISINAKK